MSCIVFYLRINGHVYTSDRYADSVSVAREQMRERCNRTGATLLCAKLHTGQRFERGGRFV